jgi:hypothetical protein
MAYPVPLGGEGHNPPCDQGDMVGAGKVDVEEETDEMSVVEMADAVVDPRAVVVFGQGEDGRGVERVDIHPFEGHI